MYNPISIVNMRHGFNLNSSTPPRDIQINNIGYSPPKLIGPPRNRRNNSANPIDDCKEAPAAFNSRLLISPQCHDSTSRDCDGCGHLSRRIDQLEDEIRVMNLRMEEFQNEVLVRLSHISNNFSENPGTSRTRRSSVVSVSSSCIGDRTSLPKSVTRRGDFSSLHVPTNLDPSLETPDSRQVIAEACLQLEQLIIEAKSRLYS